MSQSTLNKVKENGSAANHPADAEVVVRAKRRQFSASDKVRILKEAEACTGPGQLGALLRREGIYSSYLTDWRHEQEAGQLHGLSAQKRGRPRDKQVAELASLRQENAHLKAQVAQA